MREIVQNVVLVIIEILACDLFFQTFMERRFEKKPWLHRALIAVLVLAWMINSIKAQNFWVKVTVGIGTVSVLMGILYKARISQIFFSAICYQAICMGMDLILLAVVRCFVDETLIGILQKEGKINILWILFKLILFLFVVCINRKFSKRNYQLLRDDEWIRFLFFPVFTVAAIIFMLADEEMARKTMFFLAIGLMGANVILFYLIKDFAERAELNKKASLVKERRNHQIAMYESMELAYNQQKKKVHEFKNHLNCIQGLLQEDREKEALQYVSKINNLSEQHMNYFTTLNPVADVIINQKYQQALENGISMVTVLNELRGILMEDKDLVVLLSNLLNNAIEACDKLKKEQKQIKFKFVQQEERVILSIKNPIKGNLRIKGNEIKTSKKNEQEHGIGLYNIKKVIEKYGGEGICEVNKGIFSYTIIFCKKEMQKVYETLRSGES